MAGILMVGGARQDEEGTMMDMQWSSFVFEQDLWERDMTAEYILIDPNDDALEELFDPETGEARYRVKMGTIGCNAMCLLEVDIGFGPYKLDHPHPSCLFHGQGWEWNDGTTTFHKKLLAQRDLVRLQEAYTEGLINA